MRSLQFTDKELREHEERIAKYRAEGRVRTVICRDTRPPSPTSGKFMAIKAHKTPKPFKLSERMVQNACLDLLEASPKVAFAWRQNTGAVKIAKRFVRFSFKGCSDILGMLADGRFFSVECKATGEVATADQEAFLANVVKHGGFAVCVDDPINLEKALEAE